jgi:hypothetical protein
MAADWIAENDSAVRSEILRLEAYYEHKRKDTEPSMARDRKTIERLQALPDNDEQRKILPALHGQLRRQQQAVDSLGTELETRKEGLLVRSNLTPQWSQEPVCCAHIRFREDI